MAKRSILVAHLLCLILVSSANAARVTDGLLVGYDFREGSGTTVGDHSGNGEPLDLTIHDPRAVTWNGDGSLTIDDATIISSASEANVSSEGTAIKIFDAITSSEEITMEAWIVPENTIENDGPSRVLTMSFNPTNRNFTLGQDQTEYEARLRTTTTGNNGHPLRVRTDDLAVDTELQHLVYTRDPDGEAAIYIDGELAILGFGQEGEDPIDGDTSNWDDTYDFALGNELTWGNINDRDWLGTYHLVAVYDRALGPQEIKANFDAGHLVLVTDGATSLQAGDADQDLDFDQLDLVQVQIAAKYLTGQAATWGEGDWNGAPGGEPGSPPAGNGLFEQLDIVAALASGVYLTGPYGALSGTQGTAGDDQTSLVYDTGSGELSIDAPAGKELTSINITSASGKFIGEKPAVLDGAFDNFATDNVFKATFGGSFGSISFGSVLPTNLTEAEVNADLSAVGSLAGGGDLGNVDLIYVPEPLSFLLLGIGSLFVAFARFRR